MLYKKIVETQVIHDKLNYKKGDYWIPYTQEELTQMYMTLRNDVLYHAETLSTMLEELKR